MDGPDTQKADTDVDRRKASSEAVFRIQDRAKFIYEVLDPLWKARTDALKTLVSVSSGAVVLSVTFAERIRGLTGVGPWRYLALFTFLMFVISLCSGLIAIWLAAGLHRLRWDVFENIPDFLDAFARGEDIDGYASSLLTPVWKDIIAGHNLTANIGLITFVSFGLAFISLTVIGFKQLLQ